jgi:ABC-type molybdate transport system ATPase subunit
MLSVELSHRFGDFALDVAFEAPGGVTVLFGRSGSGKTSVIKAVAGLLESAGARATLRHGVLRQRRGVSSCRRTSAAWAMSSRRPGCSRISMCGGT